MRERRPRVVIVAQIEDRGTTENMLLLGLNA